MAVSRTVVIAGAGIGGLTAALTVARHGFRVVILEAAERLEEVGAGIQLSPNASRILIGLGLRERLVPHVVAPEALVVGDAPTGAVLARGPLGAAASERYGAPFWVIHRGDLQAALIDAVAATPDIALQVGTKVEDFACHDRGVTVAALRGGRAVEERGVALICADGLWSALRNRLGHSATPRPAGETAWRALVPAHAAPREFSTPAINLWLGRDAHLVHYPVKGGDLINVVAIVRNAADKDEPSEGRWSEPGNPTDLLARFPPETWPAPSRALLRVAANWRTWALHDCAPLGRWGKGPVTLLGDAAHPMLPQLAQGGAMAVEDAAVLGACLAGAPHDLTDALRTYERNRRSRTARTQRAARRNSGVYHMTGAGALLRTFALRAMGGQRLIRSYDWLYGWTPT